MATCSEPFLDDKFNFYRPYIKFKIIKGEKWREEDGRMEGRRKRSFGEKVRGRKKKLGGPSPLATCLVEERPPSPMADWEGLL